MYQHASFLQLLGVQAALVPIESGSFAMTIAASENAFDGNRAPKRMSSTHKFYDRANISARWRPQITGYTVEHPVATRPIARFAFEWYAQAWYPRHIIEV